YSLYNSTMRTSVLKSKRILAPLPATETNFEIQLSTEASPGLNDVTVFVNPRVLPELYYDNNVLVLNSYLNVQGDVFNPVLEVTIDGRFVTNGDYVSSYPVIVGRLWDENSILLKTDT